MGQAASVAVLVPLFPSLFWHANPDIHRGSLCEVVRFSGTLPVPSKEF
jgi:hypothetical protein